MWAAHAPLIPELENALRHVPPERAAATVRRVTDLFVAGASRFNELQIRLFDRILGRLMVVVDNGTLAELARRLAPLPDAPPDVIGRLAGNDSAAVAIPVLTRSKQLKDTDLTTIAATKGQGHLLAISGRPDLTEMVTDVLVDRGDRDVARNLAMNHGARFSPAGLAALASRATNDGVLAEKVARRRDVPAHVLRELLLDATPQVRRRVVAAAGPDVRPDIERIAASAPPRIEAEDAEAWRNAQALQRAGSIDEESVLASAQNGRFDETVAALAVICDVPIAVVRRLLSGEQPDAALILCQAAGFGWPTARAIVEAGNEAAPSGSIAETMAAFDRLSPSTAAEIVGFWRVCHGEWRAAS